MPQSLLAFLAMMIATTASLTQMTQSVQVQRETLKSELTIMANAVALEAIEVEAVPMGYDQVMDLNQVTRDLNYSVKSVPRLIPASGTTNQEPQLMEQVREVPFSVNWEVRYVDSNGALSTAVTDIREVIVRVYSPQYPSPLVVHRRLLGQ